MERRIFNLLERVQGESDAGKKDDLKEQTNAELGAHFRRHPNELEELAFDILNLVWHDTMEQDIVPQVIEVKTVGLGEPDYVEEDLRGGRAYWQGKGGQILSGIIRYERSVMPREEMVTALDFHQDEIVTNFWGTFDKLVAQAQEKLRQLPTTRLIELVRAGVSGGSPVFGEFAFATLSAAQIDAVIQSVAVRSKGQVTILGTQVATRLLANVGLEFSNEIKTRIFDTGQIGVYKGYPVVQVENFEDFHGHFVLPNNELWIIGRNAGRLTYYGDVPKVQQLRREAFYTRWETARDAGMLLYGAPKKRIGRIVLT
jgi:hypothetical protein